MSDQDRRTPPWLFDLLQKYVGKKFQLDAAANKSNATCKKYWTEADDSLNKPWAKITFCNPPFKRFGLWTAKALREGLEDGKVSVVIGPTGCSQTWFHKHARRGTILVPNERLVFFDSKTGKPTPGADRDTMIYIFGPGWWNKRWKTEFLLKPLETKGRVVTSANNGRRA